MYKRRMNFRPITFCAVGIMGGIFLFSRIVNAKLAASDFLFFALFFLLLFRIPVRTRNVIFVLLLFSLCMGIGYLLMYDRDSHYRETVPEASYCLEGTVVDMSNRDHYVCLTLDDLVFDGKRAEGKLSIAFAEGMYTLGDRLMTKCSVHPVKMPYATDYGMYLLKNDVRYEAFSHEAEITSVDPNLFQKINIAFRATLKEDMGGFEGELATALLLGDSTVIDSSLSTVTRRSGIAHIFAVSGLHIGILYMLVCTAFKPVKPMRRWVFLPATLLCVFYSGICGFSASSLRATIMCGTTGLMKAIYRKRDFIESIALADIICLLIDPVDFFGVGFRLSFGACMGLALFSGSFSRLFLRLRFPRFLANYLSANLSVQLFTFPILFEAFGYFPLWGVLLNFVLIPSLPVLFSLLLLCTVISVTISPIASGILFLPKSLLALFSFLLGLGDFTAVLRGFVLGSAASAWLFGCVFLSERVRWSGRMRLCLSMGLAVLVVVFTVFENVVFVGLKGEIYCGRNYSAVLLKTPEESVLILEDGISMTESKNFLFHRQKNSPNAVVLLGTNPVRGLNTAAFLSSTVYTYKSAELAIEGAEVKTDKTFSVGEMKFSYLSEEALLLVFDGVTVQISFGRTFDVGEDTVFTGKNNGMIFRIWGGSLKAAK